MRIKGCLFPLHKKFNILAYNSSHISYFLLVIICDFSPNDHFHHVASVLRIIINICIKFDSHTYNYLSNFFCSFVCVTEAFLPQLPHS